MTELPQAHLQMVPFAQELTPAPITPDNINWWPDETIVHILRLQVEDRAVERYARLRALWVRVIVRAAFDMASHKEDRKVSCRKWADDAERWLFQKSYLFNSFVSICSMLDIDPEKFRAWAKRLTKDEVRKMEHMERTSNNIRPMSDDEVFEAFHRNFRRT